MQFTSSIVFNTQEGREQLDHIFQQYLLAMASWHMVLKVVDMYPWNHRTIYLYSCTHMLWIDYRGALV